MIVVDSSLTPESLNILSPTVFWPSLFLMISQLLILFGFPFLWWIIFPLLLSRFSLCFQYFCQDMSMCWYLCIYNSAENSLSCLYLYTNVSEPLHLWIFFFFLFVLLLPSVTVIAFMLVHLNMSHVSLRLFLYLFYLFFRWHDLDYTIFKFDDSSASSNQCWSSFQIQISIFHYFFIDILYSCEIIIVSSLLL